MATTNLSDEIDTSQTTPEQVTFYSGSNAEYEAATVAENINTAGIYFLEDKKEIYRGNTLYTGPIATTSSVGVVKPSSSQFKVGEDGTLSVTALPLSTIVGNGLTLQQYISNQVSGAGHLKYKVVDALPTQNIDVYTIYLVSAAQDGGNDDFNPDDGIDNNAYNEYMYIENKWELIGTSKAALHDYATIDYVNAETTDRENADNKIWKSLSSTANKYNENSTVEAAIAAAKNAAQTDTLDAMIDHFSSTTPGVLTIQGTTSDKAKNVEIEGWTELTNLVNTDDDRIATNEKSISSINTTLANMKNEGTGINKASTEKYGVVKIGSGLTVDNGEVSVANPLQVVVNDTSINWSESLETVPEKNIDWGEKTNVTNKNIKDVLVSSGTIEDLNLVERKFVDSLPTENIEDNVIYMIKKTKDEPGYREDTNIYNEYMWVVSNKDTENESGAWELIGDTAVDLTPYIKTEDADKSYLNINSISATTGSQQGTVLIKIADPSGDTSKDKTFEVAVNGLGSAAFTDSSAYATPDDVTWIEID